MESLDAPTHPEPAALDPKTTGTPNPDARTPRAQIQTDRAPRPATVTSSAMTTTALMACGGGNENPINSPTALPAQTTETEAARFLMQASFGGTYEQIQEVMRKGFEAWLDTELAKPWVESDSHFNWITNSGFLDAGQSSKLGMDNTLWRKLMSAPDVLRQRVAFALSQIFVVSIEGLGAIAWRNVAAAAYMDVLEKNAFGNFSDLLKAVTLSPAMGTYLNMKGSVAATGNSSPDENYAREVMQLFTIGLYELNADGSRKLKNEKPIETYQQADVSKLAAILTGWNFKSWPLTNFTSAMTHSADFYSSGTKYYIGGTIDSAVKGPEALHTVLEFLANHDNVGPFIGRQLIQRLVCSNPSPAYIGRVSAAFATTLNGRRGDLKTVIKAVLLDPEARSIPTDTIARAQYGKLREPVLRLVQWARTFKAKPSNLNVKPTSANGWVGPWNIGDLSGDTSGMGQSPLRSPSVFNFYRPGYIPTQGEMAAYKITAPEFQICNEVTVAKYLNFLNSTINDGRNDVKADYTADLALAKDATALVNRYALLLAANALSDSTKKTIAGVLANQSAKDDAGCLIRIKAAIFFIMATPEYIIQK